MLAAVSGKRATEVTWIVEDALAPWKEPTVRLSVIRHTHMKKERPLAYDLKCVIRPSPSRF